MKAKLVKCFKIADSKSSIWWQQNNLAVIEVGGKKITLARKGEEVFACAHRCPHASGLLSEGFVDATGNVVCPLHGYKFSLKNGHNVSGEGYRLKTFALEEREAGFYICFEGNDQ